MKFFYFLFIVLIVSCSKNASDVDNSQTKVLSGFDSISKKLIVATYKDSIRLSSCFVFSRADSLYFFPNSFTNKIVTIAGNGTNSSTGDGALAINSTLSTPRYLLYDRKNGDIIIQDQGSGAGIRKISSNGIISKAVNTIGIGGINGFTFDNSGNYFFTIFDVVNGPVIKKLTPTGVLTKIAGTGSNGCIGDGSQALDAQLSYPIQIIIDNSNNIIFVNECGIRKISTTGIITKFCDLTRVSDFIYDKYTGDMYASSNNGVGDESIIWKISSDGTKTRIAGGGGFYQDGAKALDVKIYCSGIAVDNIGNIYFTDAINHKIFKIFKSGIIYSIGGNGVAAYSGDNGNSVLASMNRPFGIILDNEGNLVFSDLLNHRIRKIILSK
jgi:hypothetical protein